MFARLHVEVLARESQAIREAPHARRVLVRRVVAEGIVVRPLPAAHVGDVADLAGRVEVVGPDVVQRER